MEAAPDLDENGKPVKFDTKMTWLMGQTTFATPQGSVGKPVVTLREMFIIYDESSVSERMDRVRGQGSLSQTEKLVVMASPGIGIQGRLG
jgi:hypothetical protein